ncbi:MAG: transposase [Planctomycetes bacterium]|nr:transposase [Planctomycetota bacterium]
MNLKDAQERFDDWRKDYNEVRPHSSLENRPPKEFAKFYSQASLGKN